MVAHTKVWPFRTRVHTIKHDTEGSTEARIPRSVLCLQRGAGPRSEEDSLLAVLWAGASGSQALKQTHHKVEERTEYSLPNATPNPPR